MRETQRFPVEASSAAAARRFATRTLAGAGRDAVEAIELMVSELATNCIRHAGIGFEVTIERAERDVRIEVSDRAGGIPAKRSPAVDEPTGRGLQIVELLSKAWGVDFARGGGKTVWFTLAAASAATADTLCGASS